MRSRDLTALVFAITMSLVFVSCDSFFGTNLFKSAGLGQVSAEQLTGETSAELVGDAYTADGETSTAFFDALAGDPTVKAAVLGTLEDTYTDGSASPVDVQEAAALAAQIEIITTGGDAIINNLVQNQEALQAVSSASEAMAVIKDLIPAELMADKTAFSAAINAILAANDIYNAASDSLGASLLASDLQGDINIGTAAQSALVAAFLGNLDASAVMDPDTSLPYGPGATADYLWDFVNGTTSDTPLTYTEPDTSDTTPLGAILAEAGISL